METILEQLWDKYGEPRVKCPVEENRIAAVKGNFKKSLDSKQYKQLYRILDDSENIAGKMSLMNFESGLRFGIKFMAEIYAGNGLAALDPLNIYPQMPPCQE